MTSGALSSWRQVWLASTLGHTLSPPPPTSLRLNPIEGRRFSDYVIQHDISANRILADVAWSFVAQKRAALGGDAKWGAQYAMNRRQPTMPDIIVEFAEQQDNLAGKTESTDTDSSAKQPEILLCKGCIDLMIRQVCFFQSHLVHQVTYAVVCSDFLDVWWIRERANGLLPGALESS